MSSSSTAYLTPGIYRRPAPRGPRRIGRVRTDIAGFVGYAERGPLASGMTDVANVMSSSGPPAGVTRLQGWSDYLKTYGGFTHDGYLPYAVHAFFQNGGTDCWVARVAAVDAQDHDQRPAVSTFTIPSVPLGGPITLDDPIEAGSRHLIVPMSFRPPEESLIRIEGRVGGTVAEAEYGVVEGTRALSPQDDDATTQVLTLRWGLERAYPKGSVIHAHAMAVSVQARSAGSWGNRIQLQVTPLSQRAEVDEFSLRVLVAPGADPTYPLEREFYRRLSVDPESQFYAPNIVNGTSNLIEVSAHGGLLATTGPVAEGQIGLRGGQDGLASITEDDFIGTPLERRGLRLLEEIDEISILCMPDVVYERALRREAPAPAPRDPCAPPADGEPVASGPPDEGERPPRLVAPERIYRTAFDQCERLGDRVVVVDPPFDLRPREVVAWRSQFRTRFAALYYPWVELPDPLARTFRGRPQPPSGHVAGVYARVDNTFGVERPPANQALEWVVEPRLTIDDRTQETLNPEGVNALRTFPGRGLRIWGARSLASPEPSEADWRFIHVRRLMSMIRESVDEASQWAVFENHDDALRRGLTHSLTVFLEGIWLGGGLKGARPSEAFYVKCDETNNPQSVVDLGQVICEVGVAIAVPMEFLVFEIRQSPSGAQVTEL